MPAPSWRKIETALIELLPEWGFEIKAERGNSFIEVYGVEFCLADFAKELEKRL